MSAEAFINTDIFIHQLEARDRHKSRVADRIIRDAVATGNACVSFQVVQECLNTVLRKAQIPLDNDSARRYFETVLAPLFRVSASVPLYQRGLDIQARYRYSFFDSLIIAAAVEAGCTTLYSEELQHGQQIDGLIIENPFTH